MAQISQKNAMTGRASLDLGLGDQLQSQVENEINQRKKKQNAMQMAQKLGMTGSASQSLTGGFSA